MSLMEAAAAYKRGTPLRANSSAHSEDLAAIRNSPRPLDKAERLVKHRTDAQLIAEVDAMLFDLQGRRKRYRYDQAAAQQLEHISPNPFDPQTQLPLWRELLRITKGHPVDRDTFMDLATNILRQSNLYDTTTVGPVPIH